MMILVTVFSIAAAIVMSTIAWRVVRDERRRSASRIAALAADIHEVPHDLFSAEPTSARLNMRGPALALGGAAVILLLVGVTSYRANSTDPSAGASPSSVTPAVAPPAPLELVTLEHERVDDHLVVHGIVRNPASGGRIDRLTAVVLLFNQQGGFLTSGRAGVEASVLEPGTNASFTITIPGAANVGRYRVSFRTADHVVPHVDKRES